jgi:uncharacterized membrane protein YccC
MKLAPSLDRIDRIGKLHWMRGLRAGLAVAGPMIVCQLFPHAIGWATGWAALGGFESILVDNGGPYRSRFATISTLMLGGTLACLAGAAAVGQGAVLTWIVPMAVTAAFCFAVTFARVIAQPIASTSVIILVIYFVALGHSPQAAIWNALAFAAGCGWAALVSLILWPIDPFRPARLAVAECYATLAELPPTIAPTQRASEARENARHRAFEWQRRMRTRMETARTALSAITARAPSRTHRASNLTVLLETADMLLTITMRTTELALAIEVDAGENETVAENPLSFAAWLSAAELSIAHDLRRRPVKPEAFGPDTPRGFELGASASARPAEIPKEGQSARAHLAAAELDARQNLEIARDAVRSLWSGVDPAAGTTRLTLALNTAREAAGAAKPSRWLDALRSNWTLDSVMMRHALRMLVTGAADVALMRALRLSHGYWMGMTSIIVLQPYRSNTFKRGFDRVGGTIAGGILAAVLAAAISSQRGIVAVVTATSVLTLATYAVNYAWYCFFLTPTFVLLGLPHLGDWRYSGVRMLTTLLGAAVAVAAMRLLWPEREHLTLAKLLARSAAADAAYIRAVLGYWARVQTAGIEPGRAAERQILAPARRACGLASNDAEESLDRLKLEAGFGRLAASTKANRLAGIEEHALAFVTYIRRLTQSVTTLAVLGKAGEVPAARLEHLARQLETIAEGLRGVTVPVWKLSSEGPGEEDEGDILQHQLRRMERQVSVLERAAAGILEVTTAHAPPIEAEAIDAQVLQ